MKIFVGFHEVTRMLKLILFNVSDYGEFCHLLVVFETIDTETE